MEGRHVESTGDVSRHEVKVHFINTHSSPRGLFAGLSQIDADRALAEAIQEQERAYSMLRFNSTCSEHDSSASGSCQHEGSLDNKNDYECVNGDEGGTQGQGTDPYQLKTDEAFARALQDAENQEELARMLSRTGLRNSNTVHRTENNNMQDDVDPDTMSYEDLRALGEVVGSHSRGFSPEQINSLPLSKYKAKCILRSNNKEHCVICYLEYQKGDSMVTLPCKHRYHADCIKKWLEISKTCPVCGTDVCFSKEKKIR